MRYPLLFLLLCWVGAACPVFGADFHISGPTIELRRLQYCTECDNALVVTTIAPGAAVRCPHCTSVQRRLPNRLLEERVYQVCPSCASRLDVAHLDPMQQLRCGTCGLAQYVLPEAVHRPDSRAGTGRAPAAHLIPDADGRPPTWKEDHPQRGDAKPSGTRRREMEPTDIPEAFPSLQRVPGGRSPHGTMNPDAPSQSASHGIPDTPSNMPDADPKPGCAEAHTTLPPFDPRDPATLELYLELEETLESNRAAATRNRSADMPTDRASSMSRAPAVRTAPASSTQTSGTDIRPRSTNNLPPQGRMENSQESDPASEIMSLLAPTNPRPGTPPAVAPTAMSTAITRSRPDAERVEDKRQVISNMANADHVEPPSQQPRTPSLPPMPEGNPAHLAAQSKTAAQSTPAAASPAYGDDRSAFDSTSGQTPERNAHAGNDKSAPTETNRIRQAAHSDAMPNDNGSRQTPPAKQFDAPVPDPSLLHAATVNGQPILVADVERMLREAIEAMQVELGAEAHTQAGRALIAGQRIVLHERILDTLIGRELIRQAALREGYRPDEQAAHDLAETLAVERGLPRSHALLEEARFQLILEDMHRRHARMSEPVRPGDVRAYYEANLDAFREPAHVNLRTLVIYRNREGRADTRSASVIAAEVARKLRNGADYEALVHRYSECPFRDQGGQASSGRAADTPLASLTRTVRMEVERKGEGDVVGPVETVSAVVFSRIETKRPAAPRPFGEVAESIRRQLILERRNAAFEAWVEELRQGARIVKVE